jgi:hypothetical protein
MAEFPPPWHLWVTGSSASKCPFISAIWPNHAAAVAASSWSLLLRSSRRCHMYCSWWRTHHGTRCRSKQGGSWIDMSWRQSLGPAVAALYCSGFFITTRFSKQSQRLARETRVCRRRAVRSAAARSRRTEDYVARIGWLSLQIAASGPRDPDDTSIKPQGSHHRCSVQLWTRRFLVLPSPSTGTQEFPSDASGNISVSQPRRVGDPGRTLKRRTQIMEDAWWLVNNRTALQKPWQHDVTLRRSWKAGLHITPGEQAR